MTVIAWDGRTLAADKQGTSGMTRTTITKIARVNGCLLGVTGDVSVGMEMVAWFYDGPEVEKFPASNRDPDTGAGLVVVQPDRTVWKYESGPYPHRIEGPFCAFGCAGESAMVAMECGADARRAVELASKYNTGCGNGVDTLTFEE